VLEALGVLVAIGLEALGVLVAIGVMVTLDVISHGVNTNIRAKHRENRGLIGTFDFEGWQVSWRRTQLNES
jgi:hypothetical protein